MTDAERKELRELQNRWLDRPAVRRQVELFGWDEPIAMSFPRGGRWPTFREVRTLIYPDLREWFRDFFREDT